MAFLVKILTGILSAEVLVFARFFVGLLAILFFAAVRLARLEFNNKPILALRGITGGIAILCYFKSMDLIPLSDAVVLQFSYPIFATIFAFIFLKEKAKLSSLIALLVAFAGIVLISTPAFSGRGWGYFLGVISAVFAGAAVTSTRLLRRSDNAWSITLSLMLAGSLIGGALSFDKFAWSGANSFILLVAMALIATAAQLLLAYSYRYCSVAPGSAVSMSTILVTVALAYAFLGERAAPTFFIGTLLIVGSAVYLIYSYPAEQEF